MSRTRVDDRARLIYDYLLGLGGQGVTMPELCEALQLQDGSTTRSAIRRARDLATKDGLHFPPAVPQNDMTYRVTSLPGDALDPALQMSRIESGVRNRKEDGLNFMRRLERELPRDLRPIAKHFIATQETTREALAKIQASADQAALQLVKLRREDRASKDDA